MDMCPAIAGCAHMSFVGLVCLRTYHISEAVALKSSLILACCMDKYMLKAVSCDVSWHVLACQLIGICLPLS